MSPSSSDTVLFYYNPMSRGRIVHWMLEECGAKYEIKLLKWETRDHKSPEYLALNPMGQIPTIVHKGVVVTETAAICAYLADAFPAAQLAPRIDDPQRGAYYRWLFFAASDIEPAMMDRLYPRAHSAPYGFLGYSSYQDVVNTLKKVLAHGYLVGDRFSAADVYMASQIRWSLFQKNLEPHPIFLHYVNHCEDRPAFHRYMKQAGPFGA